MFNYSLKVTSKQKIVVGALITLVILITVLLNDLKFALTGFQLTREFATLHNQLIDQTKKSNAELDLSQLLISWPKLNERLDEFIVNYHDSKIVRHLIQKSYLADIKTYQDLADAIIDNLDQRQVWLVMLQNSNELRASGGFMGSFALVTIDQGKVTESVIEDVYDADGQWRGFIEAPPGVKEYLSSGKGWRLPDANWSADFSESAEQVKFFIEQAKNIRIDHVIGINTVAVSSIIDTIGPIHLSDYNLTLDAKNISVLLQNRPAEFFPGSRQKVHMLEQAKLQTLLKIKNLDRSAYKVLYRTILTQLRAKNLLFYSTNSKIQEKLVSLGWAGKIPETKKDTVVLGLIESNVGINKVNQSIDRRVKILVDQKSMGIAITFVNQALIDSDKNQNLYVNYQRILLSTNWSIKSLLVNGKETNLASNMINSTSQSPIQEIGWLIVVPPQTEVTALIKIQPISYFPKFLHLIKQSGIPSTIYTIESLTNKNEFVLDQDLTVDLTPFLENATINQ